jgi:hypothetical protein
MLSTYYENKTEKHQAMWNDRCRPDLNRKEPREKGNRRKAAAYGAV